MSNGNGSDFDLLVKQILSHENFEQQDRSVVKQIVHKLEIDGDALEDIDEQTKEQVRLEARMIYLLGKYGDLTDHGDLLVDECDLQVDNAEAEVMLNSPDKGQDGKKYTVADKEAMITMDPAVSELRATKLRAKAARAARRGLLRDLNNLARVVFGRNDKLELLGNNYRRELSADSKAT